MNQHSITKCVCGNTLRRCRCPGPHPLKIKSGPCECDSPATRRVRHAKDATVEAVAGVFNENAALRSLCSEMLGAILIEPNQRFVQPEILKMAKGWDRRFSAIGARAYESRQATDMESTKEN